MTATKPWAPVLDRLERKSAAVILLAAAALGVVIQLALLLASDDGVDILYPEGADVFRQRFAH